MSPALRATIPRRIKAHAEWSHIPVIFMTGLSETSHIVRGFEAGGVDYVVKQAAETAGIAGSVSANALRRRFVMAAHERGEDLDGIRDRVGHADVRTTRRYLDSDR